MNTLKSLVQLVVPAPIIHRFNLICQDYINIVGESKTDYSSYCTPASFSSDVK